MEEKTYAWDYEPPVPEEELKKVPPDELRCTARSKRNGRRCARYKMDGKEVCYSHGGPSFSGSNHGMAKLAVREGKEPLKYASSVPGRLLRMYEEGLKNPDIVAHVDEIALLEARIGDLLEQVEAGGAAELWREARKMYKEFRKQERLNAILAETYLEALGEVIEKGNHEIGAWDQVLKTVEQRRKLASTHHQQLVQAQQYISVAKVLEMFAEIARVVQLQLNDPHQVQAILNAITVQLSAPIEGEYEVLEG